MLHCLLFVDIKFSLHCTELWRFVSFVAMMLINQQCYVICKNDLTMQAVVRW